MNLCRDYFVSQEPVSSSRRALLNGADESADVYKHIVAEGNCFLNESVWISEYCFPRSVYSTAFDDEGNRVPEMAVGISKSTERHNGKVSFCGHYRKTFTSQLCY